MAGLQPPAIPVYYPGSSFTAPLRGAGSASMASATHDALQFLLAKTVFRARRVGAGSPTKNAHTFLPWDQIDEDGYTGWAAGSPTLYTVQAPGWCGVAGTISLTGAGAAGTAMVPALTINGGSPIGVGSVGWEGIVNGIPTAAPMAACGYWEGYCNAGDTIQLDLWYSNEPAANLSWNTAAGQESNISIMWMGV